MMTWYACIILREQTIDFYSYLPVRYSHVQNKACSSAGVSCILVLVSLYMVCILYVVDRRYPRCVKQPHLHQLTSLNSRTISRRNAHPSNKTTNKGSCAQTALLPQIGHTSVLKTLTFRNGLHVRPFKYTSTIA